MAPNHSRSTRGGDQLRLATAAINRDSRCARSNCRQRRALPKQFFNQWSFQYHPGIGDTDTNANSVAKPHPDCHTDTYSNCDTNGYRYGDANGYAYNYAKTHAYAKARTDTEASSVTATQTVGGSLPLSDERLLHSHNVSRRKQFV
jgi:hypothetical protein